MSRFRIDLVTGDKAERRIRSMIETRPDLEIPESANALLFVSAKDIETALEERETLVTIQEALQNGTEGILYEAWSHPNDHGTP